MSDEPFTSAPVTYDTVALVDSLSDLLPCPECGMSYHGKHGLGVHRSTKHGVGPRKKSYKKPKIRRTPQRLTLDRPESEPLLTADEILIIVVETIYPTGLIHKDALPTLIEWHAATERMLKSLP